MKKNPYFAYILDLLSEFLSGYCVSRTAMAADLVLLEPGGGQHALFYIVHLLCHS